MNWNLRTVVLLALPLAALACSKPSAEASPTSETKTAEAKSEAFGRLSVEQLEAKMAEAKSGKLALYIFDNNNKDRFDKGHVPGAKWVKFNDVKAADLPADKAATLVFYCANEHCEACHAGASSALALGYKNVFILPSGISGWEKAQKPIEQV
jgi:rhodanese-related sulfurtransferase